MGGAMHKKYAGIVDEGYRAMVQDEEREREALEWVRGTSRPVSDGAR